MDWKSSAQVTVLEFHPWNGSVLKVTERKSGRSVIAKVSLRPRSAVNEAAALRRIAKVGGVRAPQLYGQRDGVIIEEFIDGEPWHKAMQRFPRRQFAAEYRRAIDELIGLHTITLSTTYAGNPSQFRLTKLRKMLGMRLNVLKTDGVDTYRKVGRVPTRWLDALDAVDVEQVASELSIENGYHCLIHGDFKPDNLLLASDGELAVLDWQEVTLGSPWYELAHLFPGTSPRLREELFERYIQGVKAKGLFKGLRTARANKLLDSGLIFEELLRGWFNTVHPGGNGKSFKQEFRLTCTNLAMLTLK